MDHQPKAADMTKDGTQPKLSDLLREKRNRPFVSFEFFPPKTDDGVKKLHERISNLKTLGPLFIDFTWGAGGSTSELTLELTIESKRHGLVPNMHLTCTNMPVAQVTTALNRCKEAGIRNILALRGDPPLGQDRWVAAEDGLTCALDLVKFIREKYGDYFSISIAGYPEGHPNSITKVDSLEGLTEAERQRASAEYDEDGKVKAYYVCRDEDFRAEMAYLKKKVDAGATAIVSQMFMDPEVFITWVKECRAAGIHVPILPGIMCLNTVGGFKRMVAFCKTRVPGSLWRQVNALPADDDEAVRAFGISFGAELCGRVLNAGIGVPGVHLYTLNLEKVAVGIVQRLGLAQKSVASNLRGGIARHAGVNTYENGFSRGEAELAGAIAFISLESKAVPVEDAAVGATS